MLCFNIPNVLFEHTVLGLCTTWLFFCGWRHENDIKKLKVLFKLKVNIVNVMANVWSDKYYVLWLKTRLFCQYMIFECKKIWYEKVVKVSSLPQALVFAMF